MIFKTNRSSADAKHSRAILCMYVDSAQHLLATSETPRAVATFSVGGVTSQTAEVESNKPVFREGLTLLLGGPVARESLKVKVCGC